jgi:hypothetical protein
MLISLPFAVHGLDSEFIEWQVPTDGGSTITGFVINTLSGTTTIQSDTPAAGAVGSSLDPSIGAVDSYVIAGLPTTGPLTFSVAATNSVGTGPTSTSNPDTPSSGPTAPFAPYNVAFDTATPYQFTVHWTVPNDNGSPITSFHIGVDSNFLPTAPSPVTIPAGPLGSTLDPTPGSIDSYTLTDLLPAPYSVELWATNAIGDSPIFLTNEIPTPFPVQVNGGIFQTESNTTPVQLDFGTVTLGDSSAPMPVGFLSEGNEPDSITNVAFSGPAANDYFVDNECSNVPFEESCVLNVYALPGTLGARPAVLTVSDNSYRTYQIDVTATGSEGYYEVGAAGELGNFGDANYFGDASSKPLNRPIVGMAATGDDGGYWLVASDGGIFTYGDAPYFGSTGAIHLNKPIVGMAVTPDGGGYWMVASDGGIFAFGDAQFYGSTGAIHLNKPIVGMAVTPDGGGYWLVASDGGIFAFGDAPFYGSTGAIVLNKPIVGMAPTPDGSGYWMVASDGGIFAFGDAPFHGSTGGIHLNRPIVGMAATPDGGGYWLAASDGGVFTFGDAPFYGSVASIGGVTDAIGIVGDAPPTLQATLDVPADQAHPPSQNRRVMHHQTSSVRRNW